MRIYYLNSEFLLRKHRIVNAVYNKDLFAFDEGNMSPFSTLTIDEIDPINKSICLDIVNHTSKEDASNEGKYYINSLGELMEKENWIERVRTI